MEINSTTYAIFKEAAAFLPVFYVQKTSGPNTYWAVCSSITGHQFAASITASGDVTDFEANIQPSATSAASEPEASIRALVRALPSDPSAGQFNDTRLIRRFGNLTSTSTAEVLLALRPYAEQGSEAQRSIVSTSATDSDAAATGLRQVRIEYLTSSYVRKSVDVLTDGTTAVNTGVTDIRFIERLYGIKGTTAVGAIRLMSSTGGGGSEICGIGAATQDAFLCHHYVAAGKTCWVRKWCGVVNDDVNFKLNGQARFGSNLVDTILDLDNVSGIAVAPGRLEFSRDLHGVSLGEKTYVRVTVVPGQATSTVTRGCIELWEESS